MLNFFKSIAKFYWGTINRLEDEGFSRRFSIGLGLWIIFAGLMFGSILTIALFALYPSDVSYYLARILRKIYRLFLIDIYGTHRAAHLFIRSLVLLHLPIVAAVSYQKIHAARLVRSYRLKEKHSKLRLK